MTGNRSLHAERRTTYPVLYKPSGRERSEAKELDMERLVTPTLSAREDTEDRLLTAAVSYGSRVVLEISDSPSDFNFLQPSAGRPASIGKNTFATFAFVPTVVMLSYLLLIVAVTRWTRFARQS